MIGDFPYCHVHFIKDGIINKVKLINLVKIRFQIMANVHFFFVKSNSWTMNHTGDFNVTKKPYGEIFSEIL